MYPPRSSGNCTRIVFCRDNVWFVMNHSWVAVLHYNLSGSFTSSSHIVSRTQTCVVATIVGHTVLSSVQPHGIIIIVILVHYSEFYTRHGSQSASPIKHTVNLVFGYKVFLKVYFNLKIHADFKSVGSQTENTYDVLHSILQVQMACFLS